MKKAMGVLAAAFVSLAVLGPAYAPQTAGPEIRAKQVTIGMKAVEAPRLAPGDKEGH